jgi:hypothetical protein
MDVFANQIGFDVDLITNPAALQISMAQSERDNRRRKTVALAVVNR